MLPDEVTTILEVAGQFWEKAKPFELGLLKKQVAAMDFESVKSILETARLESKYSTFPLSAINERLGALKKHGPGKDNYITCYALNMSTGKSLEVVVMANSDEGAKVEMSKYLEQWGHDIVDYIIYTGEDNFDLFFHHRHTLRCELDPQLASQVEQVRNIGLANLTASIAKSLPEVPKKQFINTGVRVKEMIEDVVETKDYYDPDNPDTIPF